MELNKIETLLDKYFEGNTSIDEENTLKSYFSQDNIPSHLQDYKAMFNYFAQNKEVTSNKPIQVKPNKKAWRVNLLVASVAVILLFTVLVVDFKPNSEKLTKTEIKEAQKALEDTKKAFQLISKNLNKGNNAIAYLNKFESTKNKIFK